MLATLCPLLRGSNICPEAFNQLLRRFCEDQRVDCLLLKKTSFPHCANHLKQWVVKPVHIENSAGFAVRAKLCPGPGLKYLFQGTYTARNGDKAVCKLCHFGFALVHILYHE